MQNEIPAIHSWIYTTLVADSALNAIVGDRIYLDRAPQESQQFPFVIFSFQSNFDVGGLGPYRIKTRALYLVKLVCEGSPTQAVYDAANRIDQLIGAATSIIHSGFVISGRRENLVHYPEFEGDVLYTHFGGQYRLEVYEQ